MNMANKSTFHLGHLLLAAALIGGSGCIGSLIVDENALTGCSAVKPDGNCPTGRFCVAFNCLTPPELCSAANTEGKCPDGQTCKAGVCFREDDPSICPCSGLCPKGTCAADFECKGGRCVEIDPVCGECTTTCQGTCPGDAVCINGTCQTSCDCGADCPFLGDCAGGKRCYFGSCIADCACDSDCPDGSCDDGLNGFMCKNEECWPIDCTCGPMCPVGPCPDNQRCSFGVCQVISPADACGDLTCPFSGFCSTDQACLNCACEAISPPGVCNNPLNPDGDCPLGKVCIEGNCAAVTCAQDECSGLCPRDTVCGGDCFCRPINVACSLDEPTGECDGGATCEAGVCVTPICSASDPYGSCPLDPTDPLSPKGQVCDNGTCADVACSPANPLGACSRISGHVARCQLGVCTAVPCGELVDPADTGGPTGTSCAAATEECDTSNNVCVVGRCSPMFPTGTCSAACETCDGVSCVACMTPPEVCLADTFCGRPVCSVEFNFGTCPGGEVCEADNTGCDGFTTEATCTGGGCLWDAVLPLCHTATYGKCQPVVCADLGKTDLDFDGICTSSPAETDDDNCPNDANTNQANADGDTLGDVCDNCPNVTNETQDDGDFDDVGDVCDNCPNDANTNQADPDGDNFGSVCDVCPNEYNPSQTLPCPISCGQGGESCSLNKDCCFNLCIDDGLGTMRCRDRNNCFINGVDCTFAGQCCNLFCNSGFCDTGLCVSVGATCGGNADCCSNNCVGTTCEAAKDLAMCRPQPEVCTNSTQCCSGICLGDASKCEGNYCLPAGEVCTGDNACCSETCVSGRCERLTLCRSDGEICAASEHCCTKNCVIQGTSGPQWSMPSDQFSQVRPRQQLLSLGVQRSP